MQFEWGSHIPGLLLLMHLPGTIVDAIMCFIICLIVIHAVASYAAMPSHACNAVYVQSGAHHSTSAAPQTDPLFGGRRAFLAIDLADGDGCKRQCMSCHTCTSKFRHLSCWVPCKCGIMLSDGMHDCESYGTATSCMRNTPCLHRSLHCMSSPEGHSEKTVLAHRL